MKIATYNFCRGGKPDYRTLFRLFETLQPDIVTGQEACPLAQYLAHTPEYRSVFSSTFTWGQASTNYWGSFVYAKDGTTENIPLTNIKLAGWVVGVEIKNSILNTYSAKPIRIFSIHNPTRTESTYFREALAIVEELKNHKDIADLIVSGDFNLTITERNAQEHRKNSEEDKVIISKIRDELGLVNCWKTVHPEKFLDQTFHGGQFPAPPFHIDGIFIPQAWKHRIQACEVVSPPKYEWFEGDHYPMYVDIRN